MEIINVYEDIKRAESYANLGFPGTYFLAYRDLPEILSRYAREKTALDFGCGAGRSTRFLQKLGFKTIGVDISREMLEQAKLRDPEGAYCQVEDDHWHSLGNQKFGLILSVFTFDNIPGLKKKIALFKRLRSRLLPDGFMVNLVSSPDIYKHEWTSFSTKCFPENQLARTGDIVKTIMLDVSDRRPVEDILWPDEAYREVYRKAGLDILDVYRPLAKDEEPFDWVTETRIPPWVIYVLKNGGEIIR